MRNIGRYRVEKEIGRGTMGIVFLARDPRLDRRVALKTYKLPKGMTAEEEPEFQERFEREARAAAVMSHPGIVTVYDVDRDEDTGAPFIAMEFVEGESLHALLRRRTRLRPAEACDIACQVADALDAAHKAGVVHRDVKPANILIEAASGRVKVADFGVARLAESELTREGTTFGSPAYMSPEQIRCEEVDGRSDLFSLAVILYQMLTGSRPFAGDDLPALAYSIAHEPPVRVTDRVFGLPEELDEFFERALAKSPDERFASGRALRDALVPAIDPDAVDPAERTLALRPRSGGGPELGEPSADVSRGVMPLPEYAADHGPDEGEAPRSRLGRVLAVATFVLLSAGLTFLLTGDNAAYIKVEARSTIPDGQLTLFLDGTEVYRRDLTFVEDRRPRRRLLGRLRPAAGGETFEAVIEAGPGHHEVEVVLAENGSGEEHRSSVVVELADGGTEKLKLIADRTHPAPVSLRRD